jgi:hypothetical protein
MPSTSPSKMPFRNGLQKEDEAEEEAEEEVEDEAEDEVEDEAEDEALLAKCEIKNMVLAEQGGDLNKIRRSRQTVSSMIRGADGEVDEEVQEVDVAEREVVREAEPASDQGKQGEYLHAARHRCLASSLFLCTLRYSRGSYPIQSQYVLEHAILYRKT